MQAGTYVLLQRLHVLGHRMLLRRMLECQLEEGGSATQLSLRTVQAVLQRCGQDYTIEEVCPPHRAYPGLWRATLCCVGAPQCMGRCRGTLVVGCQLYHIMHSTTPVCHVHKAVEGCQLHWVRHAPPLPAEDPMHRRCQLTTQPGLCKHARRMSARCPCVLA